jgi:phospholipase/lecithinase/hemolysin
MNKHDVGDSIRLTGTYTDTATNLTDPTAVRILLKPPGDLLATAYTTASGDVQKTTSGTFYLDYTATGGGVFEWRTAGTGTIVAAGEGAFYVRRQRVST